MAETVLRGDFAIAFREGFLSFEGPFVVVLQLSPLSLGLFHILVGAGLFLADFGNSVKLICKELIFFFTLRHHLLWDRQGYLVAGEIV